MNIKTSTPQLLKRERGQNLWLYSILITLLISGLYNYLFSEHSVFSQWLSLAHSIVGIASLLLLIPFLVTHFYRTLGQRRAGLFTSGVILLILSMLMALTGLSLIFGGQTEQSVWLIDLHIASALSMFAFLIIHIVTHYLWLAPNRRETLKRTQASNLKYFPSIESRNFYWIGGFALSFFTLTLCATFLYLSFWPSPNNQPAVTDYQYNYSSHPFRPSQTETASGTFIDKNQIAGSQNCANCHQEIAEQWYSSIHKQAASDPSYVTNVSLLAKNKGIEATRYCEGCHAPVALLTGQLSEGVDWHPNRSTHLRRIGST